MSNTMSRLKTLVAVLSLAAAFIVSPAHAEIAVIANPTAAITSTDQTSVQNLFLGRSKSIAGKQFKPVDQANSAVRKKFYIELVGKTSRQLRAYWSRQIFTGKGRPPKEIGGDADVVKAVAADPNLIGYVDSSAVDSSVTVILSVD